MSYFAHEKSSQLGIWPLPRSLNCRVQIGDFLNRLSDILKSPYSYTQEVPTTGKDGENTALYRVNNHPFHPRNKIVIVRSKISNNEEVNWSGGEFLVGKFNVMSTNGVRRGLYDKVNKFIENLIEK